MDLRLRGPGDLMGTQQSGIPELHLADLVEDADLLQQARAAAQRLLDADPELRDPKHAPIAGTLAEQLRERRWGKGSRCGGPGVNGSPSGSSTCSRQPAAIRNCATM